MQRWLSTISRAVNVHIIPQLSDNYGYIVHHHPSNRAFVVDVAEARKVLDHVNDLGIPHHNVSVLTTHKHGDHSGGNIDLSGIIPNLRVYGGEKDPIPACTNPVKDGDKIPFGASGESDLFFEVLFTPCHTSGHVLYVLRSASDGTPLAVFTGDTVFAGGCGRFFEGTADDMFRAFSRLRSAVGPDTLMFPGHEYTVANYKFASAYLPANAAVSRRAAEAAATREAGQPTVPTTMREEFASNVFLLADSVAALAAARSAKDSFK